LTPPERQAVLDPLHEPRFVDLSPSEVYTVLLDEGRYVCSERTMYRLLGEHQEIRERRNQLRHPAHPVPELLARRPNEVWSWDITKLLGPAKWTPHEVHHGLAPARVAQRCATLTAAYAAHPEHFPRGIPTPPEVPTAVWINKPTPHPSTGVEEVVHCK
jgi:hypothetical protein